LREPAYQSSLHLIITAIHCPTRIQVLFRAVNPEQILLPNCSATTSPQANPTQVTATASLRGARPVAAFFSQIAASWFVTRLTRRAAPNWGFEAGGGRQSSEEQVHTIVGMRSARTIGDGARCLCRPGDAAAGAAPSAAANPAPPGFCSTSRAPSLSAAPVLDPLRLFVRHDNHDAIVEEMTCVLGVAARVRPIGKVRTGGLATAEVFIDFSAILIKSIRVLRNLPPSWAGSDACGESVRLGRACGRLISVGATSPRGEFDWRKPGRTLGQPRRSRKSVMAQNVMVDATAYQRSAKTSGLPGACKTRRKPG